MPSVSTLQPRSLPFAMPAAALGLPKLSTERVSVDCFIPRPVKACPGFGQAVPSSDAPWPAEKIAEIRERLFVPSGYETEMRFVEADLAKLAETLDPRLLAGVTPEAVQRALAQADGRGRIEGLIFYIDEDRPAILAEHYNGRAKLALYLAHGVTRLPVLLDQTSILAARKRGILPYDPVDSKEILKRMRVFPLLASAGYTPVLINTEAFEALYGETRDYIPRGGGGGRFADHYTMFQEHLRTDQQINAPVLGLVEQRGDDNRLRLVVDLSNGAEVYAVLRDMGFTAIPFALDRRSGELAQRYRLIE